ncbi:MAG TPA: hypothetical protein VK543_16820 [Puia sp.]|nr:hypothetical protein [Puia sp.]
MRKKNRLAWIIFIGLSGLLIFLFHNEMLNGVQQQLLRSIRKKAVVSNHVFVRENTRSGDHRIYSLKGIERIWPHRVNSLRRLKYLSASFTGFECDIRFDPVADQLYVAHDPGDLSPLVFEDYLQWERPKEKLFWLDVKTLDLSNIRSFCSLLERLDQKYSIKNRIIIESPDIDCLLQVMELGYLTSYYMPPLEAITNKDLPEQLKNYPGLISQDISVHQFMTKNFPDRKQLIWDIRFRDCMSREVLLRNANDTTALVFLINVKSPGYR